MRACGGIRRDRHRDREAKTDEVPSNNNSCQRFYGTIRHPDHTVSVTTVSIPSSKHRNDCFPSTAGTRLYGWGNYTYRKRRESLRPGGASVIREIGAIDAYKTVSPVTLRQTSRRRLSLKR